jgi:hypothetical protein
MANKKSKSLFIEDNITMFGTVKSVGAQSGQGDYNTLIELVDPADETKTKFIKEWIPERLPRESAVEVLIVNPDSEYPDVVVYPR